MRSEIENNEYVQEIDFDCHPSPSGSGELVIHTEDQVTFILFNAITSQLNKEGFRTDLGVAVVTCMGSNGRFGYPNDEGHREHRLWHQGLSECVGICEVINSEWKVAYLDQTEQSARRIFGHRYEQLYKPGPNRGKDLLRHLIFLFKENTYECLVRDLTITFKPTYAEALAEVMHQIA